MILRYEDERYIKDRTLTAVMYIFIVFYVSYKNKCEICNHIYKIFI